MRVKARRRVLVMGKARRRIRRVSMMGKARRREGAQGAEFSGLHKNEQYDRIQTKKDFLEIRKT